VREVGEGGEPVSDVSSVLPSGKCDGRTEFEASQSNQPEVVSSNTAEDEIQPNTRAETNKHLLSTTSSEEIPGQIKSGKL